MRRYLLTVVVLALSMLAAASAAEAAVVDMNAIGQTSVPYNPSDQSGYFGASLMPGICGDLKASGACASLAHVTIPLVTSSAPCTDPALSSDLWTFGQPNRLPDRALCYHGGPVIHQNETFALTWDAPFPDGSQHNYWAGVRSYVEQYLRDVADASGKPNSPYALTPQYTDASGRAQNSSRYGGGCIDNGVTGKSQCEFGNLTGAGHDLPVSGCAPVGASNVGPTTTAPNSVCLTDSQLQGEVSTMVAQTGVLGRTQPGYSPLVVLLTPPGVETCLDSASKLCSANGSLTPHAPGLSTASGGGIAGGSYRVEVSYVTATGEFLPSAPSSISATDSATITVNSPPPASGVVGWYAYVAGSGNPVYARQGSSVTPIGTNIVLSNVTAGPPPRPSFCSYHSQVAVGGSEVSYVVQPWTAMTGCDEPDAPAVPQNGTPQELNAAVGSRLASPLSQSQISAVVNPAVNGWFALDGADINDNGGCTTLSGGLDSVNLGSSSQNPYLIQREFNNAGAIENDPNTYFGCAPGVLLAPSFVVPSAVNQGDVVQLDGSTTTSTLIVPNAQYQWDFGDHTTAVGPSVVHTYAAGGTYTITLTVTDRGGNQAHLSQTIDVLDQNGQPVSTPTTGSSGGSGGGTSGGGTPGSGGGTGTGGGTTSPPPPPLQARILLLPQGLTTALRSGIAVRVSANEPANGFAYVYISPSAARKAGIKAGHGPRVEVGRGTLSRIDRGTVRLRLYLSRAMATKLKRLKHVTLTVRLALVSSTGVHYGVTAAAHY